MESVILLNSNENTRLVEDEEKSRFARSILESFGLEKEIEDIWDEHGQLTQESKKKLRQLLSFHNIEIIGPPGGDLQIYHENTLIGDWKKPTYVLKKDPTQKDPLKRLYLEMKISYWSILENTE